MIEGPEQTQIAEKSKLLSFLNICRYENCGCPILKENNEKVHKRYTLKGNPPFKWEITDLINDGESKIDLKSIYSANMIPRLMIIIQIRRLNH